MGSTDPGRSSASRGVRTDGGRGEPDLNTETSLFTIALVGAVLLLAGALWLIVEAFGVKWYWGLAVLVFFPVAGPIFAIRHRRPATWPMVAMAIGVVVGSAPILYNRLTPIDLGPRETMVEGEPHLTLTGWDREDYSVLASKPSAVVVQMANPDVTDQTLTYLKGMARLRELDLSGTQVGDDGLIELEGLTSLEQLRLKGTKITDAGFARSLAPLKSLQMLDLQGTGVSREAGKAWKAAKPGRRLLQ